MDRARPAYDAVAAGRFEDAARLIDEVRPAGRDRLLYLIDKGVILHDAGRFEDSNKVLTEAEDLAQGLRAKSISREVQAALLNEDATQYSGERFERMMLPALRMINYIMLDDWDEALVEVRRVQTIAEMEYGKDAANFNNAFTLYLSGIIWEAMGFLNDALIDYEHASKDGRIPYVGRDIDFAKKRLGLSARPPSSGIAYEAGGSYRSAKGEVVVIMEVGMAPRFESEYVDAVLFSVAMPYAVAMQSPVKYAKIYVDGAEVGRTYPFYNIADDIMKAQSDRRRRSVVRKTIKIAMQTALYTAGFELMDDDKTEEKLAGLGLVLVGLAMSGAETADIRSARSLPATFQIGRIYASPGHHKIDIVPVGGGKKISKEIDISPQRPSTVFARFSDTSGELQRIKDIRAEDASRRQKEIERQSRKNPHDGNLLAELAYTKLAEGDSDAPDVFQRALQNGADKPSAISGLMISYALANRYEEAAKYAEEVGHGAYASTLRALATGNAAGVKRIKVASADRMMYQRAFEHYLNGMLADANSDYGQAATDLSKAYELGLHKKLIAEKALNNFQKADDSFKKSKAGLAAASALADGLADAAAK
jgi:hypothetical protein